MFNFVPYAALVGTNKDDAFFARINYWVKDNRKRKIFQHCLYWLAQKRHRFYVDYSKYIGQNK